MNCRLLTVSVKVCAFSFVRSTLQVIMVISIIINLLLCSVEKCNTKWVLNGFANVPLQISVQVQLDTSMWQYVCKTYKLQSKTAHQKQCRVFSCFKTLQGVDRARAIDKVSRVAFPAMFIVFNVIYWTYIFYWAPDFMDGLQLWTTTCIKRAVKEILIVTSLCVNTEDIVFWTIYCSLKCGVCSIAIHDF